MKRIDISLADGEHSIVIDNSYNSLLENLPLNKNKKCKIAVITDGTLAVCQLNYFLEELNYPRELIFSFKLEPGESSKCLECVEKIYSFLMDIQITREDIIFSFGGGVVGDITGFAASTFLRGISLVHIPTTLLSQIDSSIGGKNGVNFQKVKNVIGTFYQPELIFINIKTLGSLPKEEIRNALAEAMVHGIIADPELISFIDMHIEDIYARKEKELISLIYRNCQIKASIVERDVLDKGVRQILNFAHTFGHAIESVYEFGLSHGECVSMGIIAAIKSAVYFKMIDETVLIYIRNILIKIGLPVDISFLDWESVKERIKFDKKRKTNINTFILPIKIGEVISYQLELNKDLIAYLSEAD